MAGDWKIDTYANHGEGIYRVTDQSDLTFPNGALWEAVNCVYESEADNPEAMRGATQVGSTAMGGDVTGLFDYDDGAKLVGVADDGKFYEYSGTDWAAAGTGARKDGNDTTTTNRWSGAMFYGATTAKDLLVVANGVDAPAKYEPTSGWTTLASAPSTGNFPVSWMGRLWLFSGDIAYASAPNNAEGWTIAGGAKQMPIARGQDGSITGAAEHGDSMLVFKKSSVYRIKPTQTFTQADIRRVSSNIGCVSHRTIVQAGSEGAEHLVFASEQGLEMLAATTTDVGFAVRNVTRWIKPLIDARNNSTMAVSWCTFNINRRELYFNYPTGTQTVPKEAVIGNYGRGSRKPPRWTRHDRPNLTCGAIWKEDSTGYEQVVGTTTGKVLRMHVMASATWDGAAFTSRLITPYHTQKRPNWMKEYGYSWVDVNTEANYPVTVNQVLMRRGLAQAPTNKATLSVTGVESGWGEGYWGTAVWGGLGYAGERIRPKGVRRGAGLAHFIESTQWFRLNSEIVASELKGDQIAA